MRILVACCAALQVGLVAWGDDYEVDPLQSVFAIVTHKAGFASPLAHNHFIFPSEYAAEARRTSEALENVQFRIDFPVTALVVDDPEAQARWFPRLQAVDILDEPFKGISAEDRAKVRQAMLSEKQLDAERFPRMQAEVKSIRSEPSRQGELQCTHVVTLAFTVHGQTVTRELPARIEDNGDTGRVELTGRYRFTEFGIEPYSAFLGAVKVKDEFDLYVNLSLRKKSA